MRIAAALVALLLGGAVLVLGGAPALEAWLPVFLLALGMVVGALGVLSLGHILDEAWLGPMRQPLEAMARTAPLVLLLALPLLAAPERVYGWAAEPALLEGPRRLWFHPDIFRVRAVLLLGTLVLLAALLARPGLQARRSAFGLVLLLPAAALLAQDMALSRDIAWFGSLQGTALVIEQVAAALAAALLVTLARGGWRVDTDLRGAERGLLALALLTLWLWFVQFLVVWMADLPAEAGWYLRRDGAWAWLKMGFLVPALGAAILIAIPPRSGPRRMGVVAALLLAQHLGHAWWLVRPDTLSGIPPLWLEAAIGAAMAGAWLAWFRAGLSDPPAAAHAPARASAR